MKKEIGYLDAWIAKVLRNYNITNDGTKALYNLLTGSNIQIDLVCCWKTIKKSVERRNDFVHTGTRVTKPEAEASLRTSVKQLVAYLSREGDFVVGGYGNDWMVRNHCRRVGNYSAGHYQPGYAYIPRRTFSETACATRGKRQQICRGILD